MDEKSIEGLRIIAGELMPDGYAFTSLEAEDDAQCEAMAKWLNDTEPNPKITHLVGGTYYGGASLIAKRILMLEEGA